MAWARRVENRRLLRSARRNTPIALTKTALTNGGRDGDETCRSASPGDSALAPGYVAGRRRERRGQPGHQPQDVRTRGRFRWARPWRSLTFGRRRVAARRGARAPRADRPGLRARDRPGTSGVDAQAPTEPSRSSPGL